MNGFTAFGITILVTIVCFDAAWFAFIPGKEHLLYSVTVTPSTGDQYALTVPTLVSRQGQEILNTHWITTSVPAEIVPFNTQYGRALSLTSSGDLTLKIECSGCYGELSMTPDSEPPYMMVRSTAERNFTIQLSVHYDYDDYRHCYENIFGAANGGTYSHWASGTASMASTGNWTALTLEDHEVIGDSFKVGTDQGIWLSLPCYIAGGLSLAVGFVRSRSARKEADMNPK